MFNKQSLSEVTAEMPMPDPARTAAYIEELVRELEILAQKDDIRPLANILRLARDEARRVANG